MDRISKQRELPGASLFRLGDYLLGGVEEVDDRPRPTRS